MPVRMHIEMNYRVGTESRPRPPAPASHPTRLSHFSALEPTSAEPAAPQESIHSRAPSIRPTPFPACSASSAWASAEPHSCSKTALAAPPTSPLMRQATPPTRKSTKCDNRGLEKSALESLLASDFAPAILNGKPVPVRGSVHLVCEGFDRSKTNSH